jgi:recombination protein RecT
VAVADRVTDLCQQIASDAYVEKIKQALERPEDVARYVRVAITAVQKNPDLAMLPDRPSVFLALNSCAADGLLPDGREAAIVIRKGKAQYSPMIGGFRKIAAEGGFTLIAQVVYQTDQFSYELGETISVTHIPPALGNERGAAIGAYAVSAHPIFGKFLEVMTKEQIEHVRKSSSVQSAQGPWTQHWDEMARKTVARRLFKQLPLGAHTVVAARILDADDATYEADPITTMGSVDLDALNDDDTVEGEVVEVAEGEEQGTLA